jgi:hypothetical protein
MRAIDKFILHVVYNWTNELNEAYSEGAIKNFVKKFKKESEVLLKKDIPDDQLIKYIKAFDKAKESFPSDKRDLANYNIQQLINITTAKKNPELEAPEAIDITPDVVYSNEDNTIVIYNGKSQENCVRYGRGESWCITRGSYPSYRFGKSYGYPSFYLAKNNNLEKSNPLSFVAIQVRSPKYTKEDVRYTYTNRRNSPGMERPMSFNDLITKIPWLGDIPDIKNILAYIPLTPKDMISQEYSNHAASVREWRGFDYSMKEQYLVARRGRNNLFSDMDNDKFVSDILPKYPDIATFIAENFGIIDSITLIQNLSKFNNQHKNSIIANLQEKIKTNHLADEFDFEAKKELVRENKWELNPNERLYITKDQSSIVKLTITNNDVEMSIYKEDTDFSNINMDDEIATKYLLDDPHLDQIPLKNLMKLVEKKVIKGGVVKRIIENSKTDENSAIITREIGGVEIILDSNSFASYKNENGVFKKIPFNSDEVQQLLSQEKDNKGFQQSVTRLLKGTADIPDSIDKESFMAIVDSTPYDQRTFTIDNERLVALTATGADNEYPIFLKNVTDWTGIHANRAFGGSDSWTEYNTNRRMEEGMWRSYFAYLRNKGLVIPDASLYSFMSQRYNQSDKFRFVSAQPPLSPNSIYAVGIVNGESYLINKANPRLSIRISNNRSVPVKANLTPAQIRTITGEPAAAPAAAPAADVGAGQAVAAPLRRRGRPVGGGQPRQPAPAQAAAAGNVNVTERMANAGLTDGFNSMRRSPNRSVRRAYARLTEQNGVEVPNINDRGASRRNNMLGNRGRVTNVIEVGASAVYFIQLTNNNQMIASIVSQPGNSHFIVTADNVIELNTPNELINALTARNLAEIRHFMTREYVDRNPHELDEVRELIRQHVNETKNY